MELFISLISDLGMVTHTHTHTHTHTYSYQLYGQVDVFTIQALATYNKYT